MDPTVARRAWSVLEPIHAAIYFAPEAREAFTDAGLKGFWMGYFASRAAPLGEASPELVKATFYNFAPRLIDRAIPDAWSFASPAAVLAARYRAAETMMERLLPAGDRDHLYELVELADRAARAADVEGRALFAAHAALAWPDAPLPRLWHAATLLREHRGDTHVAALVAEGVGGCEAHVIAVAAGATTRQTVQAARAWTDDEWDAAAAAVAGRELGLRAAVEARTDASSMAPWRALGDADSERLIALATPVAAAIVREHAVPVPNPIGLSSPAG